MLKNVKHVGIYAYPNVDELDLVGVYEVLTRIRVLNIAPEDLLQVEIVGSESPIKCRGGLIITPHNTVEDFKKYDMLIVPGGIGMRELVNNTEFIEKVKEFGEKHLLASICTGFLAFEKAGLLERKEVMNWKGRRLVKVRNIIFAGGASCSLDLGLNILNAVYGEETANDIAKRLSIETWDHLAT